MKSSCDDSRKEQAFDFGAYVTPARKRDSAPSKLASANDRSMFLVAVLDASQFLDAVSIGVRTTSGSRFILQEVSLTLLHTFQRPAPAILISSEFSAVVLGCLCHEQRFPEPTREMFQIPEESAVSSDRWKATLSWERTTRVWEHLKFPGHDQTAP